MNPAPATVTVAIVEDEPEVLATVSKVIAANPHGNF